MPEAIDIARAHVFKFLQANPTAKVWRWDEVGCAHADLMLLAANGEIVKARGWNPRNEVYRLKDTDEPPPPPPVDLLDYVKQQDQENSKPKRTELSNRRIDRLFNEIIGFDEVKQIVRGTVKRRARVHHAFTGPPASAKTMFVDDILKLPNAVLVQGSTGATKAGVANVLVHMQPEWLVIDEADEMKAEDQSVLLSLCENGKVVETFGDRRIEKQLDTVVFITGNHLERMAPRILSRFMLWRFHEYTYREFIQISKYVLNRQLGCPEPIAVRMADMCWAAGVRDVRTVRVTAEAVKGLGPDAFKHALKHRAG